MVTVAFEQVTRHFPGMPRPAVDALELDIREGEFMVLVGPSGCGKTVCLRLLAGLDKADSGTIRIAGQDVTRLAPRDRNVAMVFQNNALYPHLTGAQNIGFPLRSVHMPEPEVKGRVGLVANLLELGGRALARKPRALAGGERQRVAMGRAMARDPRLFLLDEPMAHLDARLRAETRVQIALQQRWLGVTTVYVTHDQAEALALGDRIAVLDRGRLQQVGGPRELYERPDNVFVAGFIGTPPMNLFTVPLTADGARLGDGTLLPLPRETLRHAQRAEPGALVLGVRPEHFRVLPPGPADPDGPAEPADAALELTVDTVAQPGADAYVHGTVRLGGEPAPVVVRMDGWHSLPRGASLRIAPVPAEVHAFSPATGARLPG